MEGSFVVESSEDGSQFEFPAYFLESINYDCDGSTIIVLATDNGGGFEQTRDELAELNGYGGEDEIPKKAETFGFLNCATRF